MDTNTSEYRKFKKYMTIGAIISVFIVALFSFIVTLITSQAAYETILDIKKAMLKENVDNTISYIDFCADEYIEDHPGAVAGEVEDAAAKLARDKIYSETHVDGTYMWVEKILNYAGGDNYAIRLIHPNLKETEGEYLSTNTLNSSGIKAYEEELEGVKNNGSIYLSYDFKKLNSDEITRKVTYSCLYERFDWIVCMGVNIDDLAYYQKKAINNMILPQSVILFASSATWLALLYVMSHIYRSTKGRLFEEKNRELIDQLDWDSVSGANSRICGQRLLEEAFVRYKRGLSKPLIAMLDIDLFKQFNDTYGHELGDRVLKSFVDAVRKNTSGEDSVIRWGGDEFIAIFYDVLPDDQPALGDRILNSVRSIALPEIRKHTVTASIGFTYFHEFDEDISEALGRADEAVYEAKEGGRNNWKIKTPE